MARKPKKPTPYDITLDAVGAYLQKVTSGEILPPPELTAKFFLTHPKIGFEFGTGAPAEDRFKGKEHAYYYWDIEAEELYFHPATWPLHWEKLTFLSEHALTDPSTNEYDVAAVERSRKHLREFSQFGLGEKGSTDQLTPDQLAMIEGETGLAPSRRLALRTTIRPQALLSVLDQWVNPKHETQSKASEKRYNKDELKRIREKIQELSSPKTPAQSPSSAMVDDASEADVPNAETEVEEIKTDAVTPIDSPIESVTEETSNGPDNRPKSKKDEIIEKLQAYINRIDRLKGKENKFSAGFIFFAQSRGVNRHANYLLAKQFLDDLTVQKKDIGETFQNIQTKRNVLSYNNHLKGAYDGSINSSELNAIIKAANKAIKEEEEVQKAQKEAPNRFRPV